MARFRLQWWQVALVWLVAAVLAYFLWLAYSGDASRWDNKVPPGVTQILEALATGESEEVATVLDAVYSGDGELDAKEMAYELMLAYKETGVDTTAGFTVAEVKSGTCLVLLPNVDSEAEFVRMRWYYEPDSDGNTIRSFSATVEEEAYDLG